MDKAVRVYTRYLVADRAGDMTVRSRAPKRGELRPSQFAFEIKIRIPIEERELVLGQVVIELPSSDAAGKPSIESVRPIDTGDGA